MNAVLKSWRTAWVLAGLVCSLAACSPRVAPDVEFNAIDGERVVFHDLIGHPTVVTFWATDCRTCLLELPELKNLHSQWQARGVRLIAVAMAYDTPSRVLTLAREAGLAYTVALDVDGRLAAAFGGVSAVPTTFLIASDGSIKEEVVGPIDFRWLQERLDNYLGDA